MMKKSENMLSGRIASKILLFALPLAASSILQQLFNSADVAVVGRFVGSSALAAVGANGPVINLLVNSFIGISVGTNVVIANYIGQERDEQVSQAAHTSLCFAFIAGIMLCVLGLAIAPEMLSVTATPSKVLPLAALYLRIYFLGVPFIMLYNFAAAILRSRGETKIPLLALSMSGLVNVILNLFFVLVVGMSVDGVAIATVISNIISAFVLFIYLMNDQTVTRIDLRHLRINRMMLRAILKIGIPAALQGAIFSISNLIIQTALNRYGANAIAGSAAALNFETYIYYLLAAFGQGAVTFIGQNYGARLMARCHACFKWCMIEGTVCVCELSLVFLLFAKELAGIFTADANVLHYALMRMSILLSFEFFNMSIEIISGAMCGFGYSLAPAMITVFGVCGVRLIWIYTVARKANDLATLLWCYPISWIITVLALAIAYIMLVKKLLSKEEI